jgi:hypothetical protein
VQGIFFALYFLLCPPAQLLQPGQGILIARDGERLLRWHGTEELLMRDGERVLARFAAPAIVVADYQDPGFLRLWMSPNVADNSLVYAQSAQEIFVNGRKVSCRFEGELRRLFYPNLQNREPCER